MSGPACATPLPMEALLSYWFGELEAETEGGLETHLLDCPGCSARLAKLVAIRNGVRALTLRGALRAVITDEFAQRLVDLGLQMREYRVPAFGSVNCSVAPRDDIVIARLEADLQGVVRVDALLYDLEGGGYERLEDVPFSPARDAVVISSRTEALRALPASTARVVLVAVETSGERVLGDYTFHHSPAD